ncbi:MAG: NUDIX hydrolase [Alphaproteobacteria bacterium]|nr:MAG: NUDIX hydrolase [Alphaproteobacteria bacterium]
MSTMSRPRGPVTRAVPPGDDRERATCTDCGFIHYENPKIIVGAVVLVLGGVLLCRRAIQPRRGFWTLPAGYMELGETAEAGAQREVWEEARARVDLSGLLAIYSVPRISQVQLIYRAHLSEPGFGPGPESLDVQAFAWDEIPWESLAFPTVTWALEAARRAPVGALVPETNPPGDGADMPAGACGDE